MRWLIALILCVALSGCSSEPAPQIIPTTEAHQKFIDSIKAEYELDVQIKQNGNTMWIYIPMEEQFLDFRGTKKGPEISKDSNIKQVVLYLSSDFTDQNFVFDYDVSPVKTYPKTLGYASLFTDRFSALQQTIYTQLQNLFTDVADDERHLKPEFVYIAIADITKGIEVKSLVYLPDLQFMMHANEEFQKRVITEVLGDDDIIDDKAGKHLDYSAIDMGHFLAKQIDHRIDFKYTRSKFPPSDDAEYEIQKQIKTVLELYEFEDFNEIILNNIDTETSQTLTAEDLKDIEMEGRLITINFNQ